MVIAIRLIKDGLDALGLPKLGRQRLFAGLDRRKSENLVEIGKAFAVGLQHLKQVAHWGVISFIAHQNDGVSTD